MVKKSKSLNRAWEIETKLSDFNRRRYDLLKDNFVFLKIAEQLKMNLDKQLSKNELTELKNHPDDKKFIDVLNPLRKVSTMLQIDWMYLFSFVFYSEPGVRDYHGIVLAVEPKEYLLEQGLYVRFHPWMTQNDWLNELEKVKYLAKTMTQVSLPTPLYPEVDAEEYFLKKQKHNVSKKDSEQNIQIYLEIETKIPQFLKEKENGLIKDVDYAEKSGVSVIDRILESLITEFDIDDDKELDRIKQTKRNVYYEVSARYALPTFRELNKYLKQLS